MTYTIEEGNHSPNGFNFGFHSKGKTLQKKVIFYPDCIYDLNDPANQKDINKAYGYTQSLFSNANSGRLGWRWSIEKQKIEMMGYVHIDGRDIKEWEANLFICDINPGQVLDTFVSDIPGDKYLFRVNDSYLEVKRKGSGTGYMEFPYFGGDIPAPHKINILITEI